MNITLITTKPIDFLQAEFNHRFGYTVGLHLWQSGKNNIFRCFLENQERTSKKGFQRFQQQVAEIVAAFVIERWERTLLENTLVNEYEGMGKGAVEDICSRAQFILNSGEGLRSKVGQRRLEPISSRIMEYFQSNNNLNIDGFIRFRLQDYLQELDRALEEAVDEYLLEKEYDEFVRLLRYFIEGQEPRLEKVHVILNPGGGFQLFDHENRNLGGEYLDGFVIDMMENDLNYEDLLISALITIAPRQVIMHVMDKGRSRNIVNTLKSIFNDRLVYCKGCHHCSKPQLKR